MSTRPKTLFKHLNFNERSKKGFIENFLTPGTRKRKALIDLSIIPVPGNLTSTQQSRVHRHFLAYVLKEDREWLLTFHDLLYDLITTKKLGGMLDRRSEAWVSADCRYTFAAAEQRLMFRTVDPACRLALWLLPERTASVFDGMRPEGESGLEQARTVQILKQNARRVTIR